jgi:hypothetical protein
MSPVNDVAFSFLRFLTANTLEIWIDKGNSMGNDYGATSL